MRCFLFLLLVLPRMALFSLETDCAIFLFDNGDKNMIASMLEYAKGEIDDVDFRIVFMGASADSMGKEPFARYKERCVHYKDLGIEEVVDHTWKRDHLLSEKSLQALSAHLKVKKKLWVGVSCAIFQQILTQYQTHSNIATLAIRDNPSFDGDSDYFTVAKEVQKVAHKIAVPSFTSLREFGHPNGIVIGHAPIEEWQKEALKLDKKAITERLQLDPTLPILVYAGVYGENYKEAFEAFLDLAPKEGVEVLIVPHPRYKGVVEREVCEQRGLSYFIGTEETLKTVDALCIADLVITADATSTIVFQASALGKKVGYVNPKEGKMASYFAAKKLLYPISSREQMEKLLRAPMQEGGDVFALLQMPKNSSKLLWDEFKLEE